MSEDRYVEVTPAVTVTLERFEVRRTWEVGGGLPPDEAKVEVRAIATVHPQIHHLSIGGPPRSTEVSFVAAHPEPDILHGNLRPGGSALSGTARAVTEGDNWDLQMIVAVGPDFLAQMIQTCETTLRITGTLQLRLAVHTTSLGAREIEQQLAPRDGAFVIGSGRVSRLSLESIALHSHTP